MLILVKTESKGETNRIKYPHLAGTALQLFQLASLQGSGKEPDVAVSKTWNRQDISQIRKIFQEIKDNGLDTNIREQEPTWKLGPTE
jgi:hypothetical protein